MIILLRGVAGRVGVRVGIRLAGRVLMAASVVFSTALALGVFSPFPAYCDAAPKRFDGVEITVGVMAAPAIGNPAKAHALTWENATGGKVRIVEYPFDVLFEKFMQGLTSKEPVFDVIFFAPQWAGDFFEYLAELPDDLLQDESLDDILPIYRDRLMKWEGKTISVTVDGDLYTGYYRKDLFEDARNRADFKARFGYDLGPPETWRRYRDIASFFNGRKGPDGRILSGATEPFAVGSQEFGDIFSRAAVYTNPPDAVGGQFFSPDTMKAQINNPGWQRAIQDYVEILKYCPEGSLDYGILETRRAFVRGDAALTLDWGDTGQLAVDPAKSAVVGKVGCFVLPGANAAWDYKRGVWENHERSHRVSFLAFGGWVGGVPKNSKHRNAAWDFILWYGNPENSLHDVVSSDTGINPYRYSHFTNIDAWTTSYPRIFAMEYLDVVRISLESPHVALDLRLPGANEYVTALERQIRRVLTEGASVEDALDLAAADWEKITDRLGRSRQLAIYRASMGLPPK